MFLDYFKLAEEPFGVTPDSRFLYLGAQHREALASLVYGTQSNRGFLALIAKPGMGKTTLLYQLMETLREKARTALVFRTDCDSKEFIRHVLIDLGIDVDGKDLPAMHQALNQVLVEEMQAGRRFVLVIDEAQNLDEQTLESIRLLSNFETPWAKLMQIVIAGQPGLAEKLSRPSLTQLRQRISLVVRIAPMNQEEVNAYIDHRLSRAGCKELRLFSPDARSLIAEHSEGIPRKINNLCFNAMSLACALGQQTIEHDNVLEVIADLDLESLIEKPGQVAQIHGQIPIGATPTPPPLEWRKAGIKDWAPRCAVAAALVLAAVTSVSNSDLRAADPVPAAYGPMLEQVSIPEKISASPVGIEPPHKREPSTVRLLEGQTLYQISVRDMGRYYRQTLDKIRKLNSWLTDPTRIRAGQGILTPSPSTSPSQHQSVIFRKVPSFSQDAGEQ
jgi:general secretion pathway protein A